MECLFCKIINGEINSYTIYENDYVKCYLDINPSSTGHTLIVPKKHIEDVIQIDNDTLLEVNNALKEVVNLIDKSFNPDGYKFTVNYGACQDIKHYHLHIIPEYESEPLIKDIKEVYSNIIK